MSKFAVIGHPIAHSLSPKIFNALFKKYSPPHTYVALDIPTEYLESFLIKVKKEDLYSGLSVTIPHKEKILNYLDEVSPTAKDIYALEQIGVKEIIIWNRTTSRAENLATFAR